MEQMQQKLDELLYQVGTYHISENYKNLLEFIKKLPHLAPYNAFLVHMQKPGAQYVATAEEWEKTYHRYIKPGARPLIILYPFAPVLFVFELGDTYGDEPFPEEVLHPFRVTGRLESGKYNRLVGNLPRIGVFYREEDYGTDSAGFIERVDYGEQVVINEKHDAQIFYHLVVNKNLPLEAKFATVAHELGHLYCGHFGYIGDRLDRATAEFEAECVSWIVCERAGIHSPSARYLHKYLGENKTIPFFSFNAVLTTAGLIESMMERTLPIKYKVDRKK